MGITGVDLVLVADGERAICFRPQNNGWEHLRELWKLERKSLLDHLQGRDRPGRYQRAPGLPLSSHNGRSRHDAAIVHFLQEVAAMLESTLSQERAQRLVIVASPVVMGILRSVFSVSVRSKVSKEILRDYTRTPHERLEKLLAESLR